jgi:hypothetical protein
MASFFSKLLNNFSITISFDGVIGKNHLTVFTRMYRIVLYQSNHMDRAKPYRMYRVYHFVYTLCVIYGDVWHQTHVKTLWKMITFSIDFSNAIHRVQSEAQFIIIHKISWKLSINVERSVSFSSFFVRFQSRNFTQYVSY